MELFRFLLFRSDKISIIYTISCFSELIREQTLIWKYIIFNNNLEKSSKEKNGDYNDNCKRQFYLHASINIRMQLSWNGPVFHCFGSPSTDSSTFHRMEAELQKPIAHPIYDSKILLHRSSIHLRRGRRFFGKHRIFHTRILRRFTDGIFWNGSSDLDVCV